MIKVEELKNTDAKPTSYLISAFADTKAEVQSASFSDYVGLPTDATEIEMGSDVMTASGELAFMQSNGTWKWQ